MAQWSGVNAYGFQRVTSLDLPSVAAGVVSAETFAVSGLNEAGGPVVVEKRTSDSGLVVVAARVSAADELELVLWNPTGAAINAAAQDFYIVQL